MMFILGGGQKSALCYTAERGKFPATAPGANIPLKLEDPTPTQAHHKKERKKAKHMHLKVDAPGAPESTPLSKKKHPTHNEFSSKKQ